MQRDLRSFDRLFDVLVIGGGIYGACVARLAARCGWTVALLERGDFGGGVSHNSLKIVHGGFRYVQHLDWVRIRESVAAQRAWLTAAPHLVRPMRCVIPAYGWGTRGPAAFAAGTVAYHALAGRRNRGLRGSSRLPWSGVMSRRTLLAQYPDLTRPDVTGGAYWYDAQIKDANRLIFECIQDASEHGAAVANHVEAVQLRATGQTVEGALARDVLTGQEFEVRARVTVNATGPMVERLLQGGPAAVKLTRPTVWTRNVNLVVRKVFATQDAVGVGSERASDAAVGKSKRLFFVTAWQDRSIVGTSHIQHDGAPDDIATAVRADVDVFVDEVSGALPRLNLTAQDVLSVHSGLTPADDEVKRKKRSTVINHGTANGVSGLISVMGIKLTTAPIVALEVLDEIAKTIGSARVAGTFVAPLPGSVAEQTNTPAPPSSEDAAADTDWATRLYGSRSAALFQALPREGLTSAEHVFRCRVLYGVANEMVVRLSDAIFRATDLAERGHLTAERLEWCAATMSDRLSWTPQRRETELRDVAARLAKATVAA